MIASADRSSSIPTDDDLFLLGAYLQEFLKLTSPLAPVNIFAPNGTVPVETWALEKLLTAQLTLNAVGQHLRPFGTFGDNAETWIERRDWAQETRSALTTVVAMVRRIARRWGIPTAIEGKLEVQNLPGGVVIPNANGPGDHKASLAVSRESMDQDGVVQLPPMFIRDDEYRSLESSFYLIGKALVDSGKGEWGRSGSQPAKTPTLRQRETGFIDELEDMFRTGKSYLDYLMKRVIGSTNLHELYEFFIAEYNLTYSEAIDVRGPGERSLLLEAYYQLNKPNLDPDERQEILRRFANILEHYSNPETDWDERSEGFYKALSTLPKPREYRRNEAPSGTNYQQTAVDDRVPECEFGPVRLFGAQHQPEVLGHLVPKLSPARYRAIKAMIVISDKHQKVGVKGVSKMELENENINEPQKRLKEIRAEHELWAKVIRMAGGSWAKYEIVTH